MAANFASSVAADFRPKQAERIKGLFSRPTELDPRPVNELMAALVANGS